MRPFRHSLVMLAFAAAAVLRADGVLAGEVSSGPSVDGGAGEEPREEEGIAPPAMNLASEQPPETSEVATPSVVPTSTASAAPRAKPIPPARSLRAPARPPVSPTPVPAASAPAPAASAPAPAAPPPAESSPRPRGTRIDLPLEVEVHGRLYVGVGADERDDWARRLDLDEARIGIEARLPGVLTVLEADVASQTPIKDAFARIDGPYATRLQAGRFKAPFSARELESSWRLPLIDRGLVNDYLVDDNDLGGRRLGATAGVRPWKGRLEAVGGVFAGERSAFGGEHRAQDLAARVSASPWKPLELGTTAYRAGSSDALVPVTYAASVYAQVSGGPLGATVEGLAGKIAAGDFTAGTALVGWTVAVGETRRLRVTPVAGGEVLELRGTTRGVGYSAIAGAVLSWMEGLKVKLQGERARRPGDDVPGTALAMQIATRF